MEPVLAEGEPVAALWQGRAHQRFIDGIPWKAYMSGVVWQVEYTDEFGRLVDGTGRGSARTRLCADTFIGRPAGAPRPRRCRFRIAQRESADRGTAHMRELRVQSWRPARCGSSMPSIRAGAAILLIGGDKTGQDDFYTRLIPLADRLYDEHLAELAAEAASGEQDDGG